MVSHTNQEHKLEFFKNSVHMKIFEPKRHEARGGQKEVSNEELQDFCSSPDIQAIRTGGTPCTMGVQNL
jgi:hypothetical protein